MNISDILFKNTSVKQTVLKNTVWSGFANVLSRFFKLFLVLLAARVLGPSNYGTFNYTISLISIIFIFSDLGISTLMVREYQKDDVDKNTLITTAFILKLILITLSFFATLSIFFISTDIILKQIFFVLLTMMVVDSLKTYLLSLAEANNRMEYTSVSFILETGLTSILGITALTLTGSVFWFSVSYLIGSLFASVLLICLTAKYLRSLVNFQKEYAHYLIHLCWPFVFTSAVGLLASFTDIIMIKWLTTVRFVGLYSAGLKILQFLYLLPIIFSKALYPFMSRYHQDKENLIALMRQSLSAMLMIAFPLLIGGVILSGEIVLFIFGPKYSETIPVLQILLLSLPIFFVLALLNKLLLALNYQVKNMIIICIATACNIGLNLILIPRYFIIGATIATLTAYLLDLFLTYLLSRKLLSNNLIDFGSVMRYLISSLIMGVVLLLIQPLQLFLGITIIIGVCVYFIPLLLVKDHIIFDVLKVVKHS